MSDSLREYDESKCKFISSNGFIKLSHYYTTFLANRFDLVETETRMPQTFEHISGNKIVHLMESNIKEFIRKLDTIHANIVLIVNNNDETFPEYLSTDELNVLLTNDKIKHLFVQNCVISHSKITKLPVALSYHHLDGQSSPYGKPLRLPLDHECQMLKILAEAKPLSERKIKAYLNIGALHRFGYDRAKAMNEFPKHLMYHNTNRLHRFDYYEELTEYAFCISPLGNGYDCHRTWEALILGSIPIVRHQPIEDLFEDLPVLIVNEWSDVTEQMLHDTIEKFKHSKFNLEKLELSYWRTKINSKLVL